MKTKSGLFALAVGTFALGIAEFSMMGILSDVSKELGISVDRAGHLISAYSIGVAVGAPLLIFLRKLPLRTVLLILAATIVVGNTFAALSPGYVTLLIARFISGLPHGAFFGTGAIVCARLAEKGKGAAAVAVMVGGMTIANVFGVPAATFVSNALIWRYTFALVALFGLIAFICIRFMVPYLAPLPDTGMKGQFRFLKSAAPWLIYGGVFFGQAGVYCWLSYISPIMTHVTGFTLSDMTWIMVLVGVGMVTGNFLSGKCATRFSPAMVSATIAAMMLVVLPLIYFCSDMRLVSLILAFVASACLFGIGGPPQFLIVGFSKGGEMLGGAGIQIAFNVSNACSAAIGGAAIHHGLGFDATALLGIPFAFIGMICFMMLHHKYKSKGA
ncbi:MAG: MFS transporter [Muribaculaceae bacterium]|nr:MFS transporter [Muribaculaceae bacterium]